MKLKLYFVNISPLVSFFFLNISNLLHAINLKEIELKPFSYVKMKYKNFLTPIKIYLCKKYESNLAIFSKDMERKHLCIVADRDDRICWPPH